MYRVQYGVISWRAREKCPMLTATRLAGRYNMAMKVRLLICFASFTEPSRSARVSSASLRVEEAISCSVSRSWCAISPLFCVVSSFLWPSSFNSYQEERQQIRSALQNSEMWMQYQTICTPRVVGQSSNASLVHPHLLIVMLDL